MLVRTTHPPWVKKRVSGHALIEAHQKVGSVLERCGVRTVCADAHCPNILECFKEGRATFLIMGPHCSRHCRFCGISSAKPSPLDPSEPDRIAEAVDILQLDYVVITSVTRDDLEDGGSDQFVRTIEAVKRRCPSVLVETLIPDFMGAKEALERLLEAGPVVVNHNVETVPRLYSQVRPEADFERSVGVLQSLKDLCPKLVTKSGLMVGLGEEDEEVKEVLTVLAEVFCDIVTIGQYLPPSPAHLPVERYVEPERFKEYARMAEKSGIPVAFSGCFVRSSWGAAEAYQKLLEIRSQSE